MFDFANTGVLLGRYAKKHHLANQPDFRGSILPLETHRAVHHFRRANGV
jgi:hypothetical protein